MQLDSLEVLDFGGQDLCAPRDEAFQAWLSGISSVNGPTCSRTVEFAGAISDQRFTVGVAVRALTLPEASGGLEPYIYTLEPPLPAGLVFDDTLRAISGVPAEDIDAASYTYSATDSDGSSASQTFTIEVARAVALEGNLQDQSYPRTHPVVLVLPEASGGVPPISYALTPALPEGLAFDASLRTISGTPTELTATPVSYRYSATDINGSADSLLFSIDVFSPVDVKRQSMPQSFVAHGNYPNPFRESTRLVFDLPWPARVAVEVVDLTGRRVLTVPAESLPAGWGRSVDVSGTALPSGLYLFRLVAASPEGNFTNVGRFTRFR